MGLLVDYEDSDEEETEIGSGLPTSSESIAPAMHVLPATEQPPAKKAKKEISLAVLLHRHDTTLPFEEASQARFPSMEIFCRMFMS